MEAVPEDNIVSIIDSEIMTFPMVINAQQQPSSDSGKTEKINLFISF